MESKERLKPGQTKEESQSYRYSVLKVNTDTECNLFFFDTFIHAEKYSFNQKSLKEMGFERKKILFLKKHIQKNFDF